MDLSALSCPFVLSFNILLGTLFSQVTQWVVKSCTSHNQIPLYALLKNLASLFSKH
jgi:hypothetical protein